MHFFKKCEKFIKMNQEDQVIQSNGTILLNVKNRLKAKHIIHKGINVDYINKYLVNGYKNVFPENYILFLNKFNGMALFRVKITVAPNIAFEHARLLLFGLPLKTYSERTVDEDEPFDIRVQDQLDRHKEIPNHWLKIGQYNKNIETELTYDIYIDTDSGKIYLSEYKKYKVDYTWDDLDKCLCDLFDSLTLTKWDYKLEIDKKNKKNTKYFPID